MSINLSVIFYGKGVPRRPYTCWRREVFWGRDNGEGRWRLNRCCHGVVDWREVSGIRRRSRSRQSGGAGCGGTNRADGVHSPLTRARGERRSRSVPRLKVAGHVTKGAHPLASASRLTPSPTFVWVDNRALKWTFVNSHFLVLILNQM